MVHFRASSGSSWLRLVLPLDSAVTQLSSRQVMVAQSLLLHGPAPVSHWAAGLSRWRSSEHHPVFWPVEPIELPGGEVIINTDLIWICRSGWIFSAIELQYNARKKLLGKQQEAGLTSSNGMAVMGSTTSITTAASTTRRSHASWLVLVNKG